MLELLRDKAKGHCCYNKGVHLARVGQFDTNKKEENHRTHISISYCIQRCHHRTHISIYLLLYNIVSRKWNQSFDME